MQIKVSKHVDLSGKIYLPYLHEWSYPNSDLVGLIQVCWLRHSSHYVQYLCVRSCIRTAVVLLQNSWYRSPVFGMSFSLGGFLSRVRRGYVLCRVRRGYVGCGVAM